MTQSQDEILLPITIEEFESLLEKAAGVYNLPTDDAMRKVLAGYVHHIPNERNSTTVLEIAKVLYKSVSNALTWRIDQEIKTKAREALIKANQEAEGDKLSVVPQESSGEPLDEPKTPLQ